MFIHKDVKEWFWRSFQTMSSSINYADTYYYSGLSHAIQLRTQFSFYFLGYSLVQKSIMESLLTLHAKIYRMSQWKAVY